MAPRKRTTRKKQLKATELHPKVKAGLGGGVGASAVLIALAALAGVDLPQPVADGIVVLAGLVAGYLQRS